MLCAAFVASIILTHKVGEEGREGAARGEGVLLYCNMPRYTLTDEAHKAAHHSRFFSSFFFTQLSCQWAFGVVGVAVLFLQNSPNSLAHFAVYFQTHLHCQLLLS